MKTNVEYIQDLEPKPVEKVRFAIIVDSEESKEELINESEYVHYLRNIDSDRANNLMHIYSNPEAIIVNPNLTWDDLKNNEEKT